MALTNEDKEFIRREDDSIKLTLENKITKIVLGQIVSALPIIFFLGGIYFEGREAIDILQNQQQEIAARGVWMTERERWEANIEDWAIKEGYTPSRYPPRTYAQIVEQEAKPKSQN